MTDDVKALMRADAAKPPPKDRLDKIRKEISKYRDYEVQRASFDEQSKELGTKIFELRTKTLPDMMDAARVANLGVEAEGNLPPFEIELFTEYKANIPKEHEAEAFAWLRKNKHGDMIKANYTVSFGMGQDKAKKAFEAYLNKQGLEYEYKFGVPWNTLTAFVKEQIEDYKKTLPMKILGATVTRLARLVKEKKPRAAAKKSTTTGKK